VPGNLIELMTFLRDDAQCQFVNFIDICGVDWPGRARPLRRGLPPAVATRTRIRVKVMTDEDTPVPSLTSVYSRRGLVRARSL
jgi:NADH-quinone oxidoreductase subunit C